MKNMVLEYSLSKEDFLIHQLFIADQSERIQKKKKNGWLILIFGSLAAALYFFLKGIMAMTTYFIITALLFGFFYPKYFKWRFKKHYIGYIEEHYKNRIDKMSTVEITEEYITAEDKTGDGKIFLSAVESVNNLPRHIFIKFNTGVSFILPKDQIDSPEAVLEKFESLGKEIADHTTWSW